MPRTKRAPKSSKKSVESSDSIENQSKYVAQIVKEFDEKCKEHLHNLRKCTGTMKQHVSLIIMEARLSIPFKLGNKTIAEVCNSKESTFFHTLSDTTSSASTFEAKSTKQRGRSKKRSLSVADCEDEGYLTVASEENSLGSSRTSRARAKQLKTTRMTRSVSRSGQVQLLTHVGINTPANPIPAKGFGTVTPKVKPNTPQVILRRPQEGEMAISMQGSPLMVNTIVSKQANVNIPLDDGRTISIQPQLGLRVSELPPIDPTVMHQIKALRDNLIKMCLPK